MSGMGGADCSLQDYQNRYSRNYRSPDPNKPFPHKPPLQDPEYAEELERLNLTTLDARIRAIGVFDTVGTDL